MLIVRAFDVHQSADFQLLRKMIIIPSPRWDERTTLTTAFPGSVANQRQFSSLEVCRLAPKWRIYLTSRLSHISPFLRQLHWLKAHKEIDYTLAVLVCKCLHGTGPADLADEVIRRILRVRRLHSIRLFVGLDYQHMFIVRFLSLVLVSGTVFHLTSNQLTSSKFNLEHVSFRSFP